MVLIRVFKASGKYGLIMLITACPSHNEGYFPHHNAGRTKKPSSKTQDPLCDSYKPPMILKRRRDTKWKGEGEDFSGYTANKSHKLRQRPHQPKLACFAVIMHHDKPPLIFHSMVLPNPSNYEALIPYAVSK